MPRTPIPTWFFAVVLVRRGDRFLLVQERKHGQLWYLPAGRAEAGESLADAAVRETLEEAGIRVRLTGILAIEHNPKPDGARVRAVFVAEPIDDAPPKSVADNDSLQAAWVTVADLKHYPLRGSDVRTYIDRLESGVPLASIELLRPEGC